LKRALVLAVILGLGVAACGEPATSSSTGSEGSATTAATSTSAAPAALVASDLERQAPSAPAEDVAAVAAGERAFAAEVYAELASAADGNLVFSPASIRTALAMAYAGARGDTRAEMASVLHFDLPDARLHAALNTLDQALASRNRDEGADPNGEQRRVLLTVANALWGQQGYGFLSEFLDTLARYYGAGMRVVDFTGAAEAVAAAINDWVAEATNGRITDLVHPGDLNDLTRLVIVNAVYLDANWAQPFAAINTHDGAFYLLGGSRVIASFMHQEESFLYAAGDGWQAVELPYIGEELAMLLVVPDAGRFSEVEGRVGSGLFDDAEAALESREVNLALPKCEFRFEASLGDALTAMGMPRAFVPGADFSGISGGGLFISGVEHQAFIRMDEAGTEAAAVTGVTFAAGTMTAAVVELAIDRPFLFSLYDRATGEVLFMGRVISPAG
jgi:serpin B